MDLSLFFAILGGLLVLAFVANRLVRFTHVWARIVIIPRCATGVAHRPRIALG